MYRGGFLKHSEVFVCCKSLVGRISQNNVKKKFIKDAKTRVFSSDILKLLH